MTSSVYDTVTSRIIEAMEKGVVPWRKPWHLGASWPRNGFSRHEYRGINLFLLSCTPYRDHRWLTYLQARHLGGYVRPGEKSTPTVFWKRWEVPKEKAAREEPSKVIPLLRQYHVFNVEQCEDLELAPLPQVSVRNPDERVEAAQALVRNMPSGPEIDEDCREAWYKPSEDLIGMPPFHSFESADSFYSTLFHELGHATGHESRLNRPGVMGAIQFGSSTYGHEELVAELTSAYCCASVGIDNSVIENSAAYIQNWLKVLKSNPKEIVTAASQAQRAADLITGRTEQATPSEEE